MGVLSYNSWFVNEVAGVVPQWPAMGDSVVVYWIGVLLQLIISVVLLRYIDSNVFKEAEAFLQCIDPFSRV